MNFQSFDFQSTTKTKLTAAVASSSSKTTRRRRRNDDNLPLIQIDDDNDDDDETDNDRNDSSERDQNNASLISEENQWLEHEDIETNKDDRTRDFLQNDKWSSDDNIIMTRRLVEIPHPEEENEEKTIERNEEKAKNINANNPSLGSFPSSSHLSPQPLHTHKPTTTTTTAVSLPSTQAKKGKPLFTSSSKDSSKQSRNHMNFQTHHQQQQHQQQEEEEDPFMSIPLNDPVTSIHQNDRYYSNNDNSSNSHVETITAIGGQQPQPLIRQRQPSQSQQQQPSNQYSSHLLDNNNNNNNSNNNTSKTKSKTNIHKNIYCNKLNLSLFLSYALTAAATSVPVTLVPTMALDLIFSQNNNNNNNNANDNEASSFASHIASTTVLATSLGKFLNGPTIDLFGARRILLVYTCCLSLSMMMLSFVSEKGDAIWWCASVEFFSSVLWPCIMVILSSHYGSDGGNGVEGEDGGLEAGMETTSTTTDEEYEGGVYVCSLAGRFGTLLSIVLSSWMLRSSSSSSTSSYTNDDDNDEEDLTTITNGWRSVARCGSLVGLVGCFIIYAFVTDSPGRIHHPQNPIRLPPSSISYLSLSSKLQLCYTITSTAVQTSIYPSLKSVLSSSIFWIVAAAHAGGSMIRSSDKILGTYYRDTSPNNIITENQAGGFTIFLSLGMLTGLAIHGRTFASLTLHNDRRERKWFIVRLYVYTVCMCYVLSLLAIPFVRNVMIRSSSIVILLQLMATFVMGSSIAVPLYHIPAIVGQTSFGAGNRGLYASYTDGVSYGVSSIVWRIVDGAVEEGHARGSGWAYGWAAVALLVILCGVIMMEFMEHYFVGFGDWKNKKEDGIRGGGYDEEAKGGRLGGGGSVPGVGVGGNGDHAKVGNLICMDNNFGLSSSSTKGICNRSDPFQRCSGKSLLDLAPASPLSLFKTKPKRSKSVLEMEEEVKNDSNNKDEGVSFFGVEDENIFQNNADVEAKMVEALQKKSEAEALLLTKPKGKTEPLMAINLKERVEALLESQENQTCIDCTNLMPRWATIIVPTYGQNSSGNIPNNSLHRRGPMGCFCCTDCAASHRRLGTHILFVRSIDHDKFKEQEVRALEESGGNVGVNRIYEAKLQDKSIKPQHSAHSWTRESFTTIKYQRRQWADFSIKVRNSEATSHNKKVLKNGIKARSFSPSHDDDSAKGLIELVNSPTLATNNGLFGKEGHPKQWEKSAYTSLVSGYESDSGSEDSNPNNSQQQQHGHFNDKHEVQLGLVAIPGNNVHLESMDDTDSSAPYFPNLDWACADNNKEEDDATKHKM